MPQLDRIDSEQNDNELKEDGKYCGEVRRDDVDIEETQTCQG
jgi:hypothetical protein